MTTPITHNSRNPHRLQRAILNLAYRPGGITHRQLAKLLGRGLSDTGLSIQGLLADGLLYETRTDRQTTYHTATLHLDPAREKPDVTLAMVTYLGQQGARPDTAINIAPKFGLTPEQARANLERAVADGLASVHNVGRLRLYRAHTPAA